MSAGKESLVVEDCGSPEIKPICSRNNPKRKVESLSAEVHAENISTSKVSAVKRTKKGVKQARAEETVAEVKTKLLATKQELSVRTNEVTGASIPFLLGSELASPILLMPSKTDGSIMFNVYS